MSPTTLTIPRIIHQTWKDHNLPIKFMEWSQGWRDKNPSFKYCFYTDEDCNDFVKTSYPQYYKLYKSAARIEKVDIFRYLVIHKYGGVYVDLDCECLKSIDALINIYKHEVITGFEYNHPVQYLQWFIASPPGSSAMIELMDEIVSRSNFKWFKSFVVDKNKLVYWFTGPEVYTYVLRKTDCSVVVLDKGVLGCYDKSKITKDSYIVHWFSGTWKD